MKPKTMILMVVAIGCGLAASYMTSKLLAERNVVANEVKVKVIVAKQKVPQWNLIKETDKYFAEKELPEGSFPKKALTSFEKLKGGVRLNKPLSEEAVVTEDDLVSANEAGLSAELPPGMRAVAIRVNAESSTGGFVLPRTRVDVISTMRRGDNESFTQVIMQDMLVLAVDTTATRNQETPTILGNTVTLAATPEEAQKLALASSIGELRLTLRPLGDNDKNPTRPTRVADLGRQNLEKNPNPEDQGADTGAVPPPPVPQLPPVKEAEPTPVVEAKEPEPEPEPAKKVETHVLTIINGEFIQKAVFTREEGEEWKNGSVSRSQPDDGPTRREAAKPAAPAEAEAAPSKTPAAAPAKTGAPATGAKPK